MLAATAAAEEHHFWFRGLRRNARLMLDQAGVRRGLSLVLDCGAGTGRNLEWLSEYGPAFGVDLAPIGLAACRRRGQQVAMGNVCALPFPTGKADLATSFDVLYALDDRDEAEALSEMQRVLKPGGVALVNAAALTVLRGSHSALTLERRRYTTGRLRAALEAAGFVVERATYTNLVLFPPVFAVRGLQRLTGRADAPSDAELQVPPWPINACLDLCLSAENGLLAVANLPIGTSVMALARRR